MRKLVHQKVTAISLILLLAGKKLKNLKERHRQNYHFK